MQFLVYLIAYPFLWLISILPFPIFYLFSDFVYFLIYYVVVYRKKVVRENLVLALPHLSDKELLVIEKKFYQHMCDMFLEMIKTMTISHEEMSKRFKLMNIEVVKEYENRGKSIILFASHYASFEWLLTLNSQTKFKGVGVYKKIANPYFDKLVRKIRSEYGTDLAETRHAIPMMAKNAKQTEIMYAYGLVSDQSPKLDKAVYWNKFLGIEVPIHTGAEMLAKRYDLDSIFIKVKKVKRGYYEATFVPVCDNPREAAEHEITDTYTKMVEQQIIEAPEYYLWTHKRFKHRR